MVLSSFADGDCSRPLKWARSSVGAMSGIGFARHRRIGRCAKCGSVRDVRRGTDRGPQITNQPMRKK